jgi:hypothetical protein
LTQWLAPRSGGAGHALSTTTIAPLHPRRVPPSTRGGAGRGIERQMSVTERHFNILGVETVRQTGRRSAWLAP